MVHVNRIRNKNETNCIEAGLAYNFVTRNSAAARRHYMGRREIYMQNNLTRE